MDFVWTDECTEAVDKLKKYLTSEPLLKLPDLNAEFILYIDASNRALGCVLAQLDSKGNEYVCAYGSRKLKAAEINYSTTERECLAVVWGIKHFRYFLHGRKFTVITDH